MPRYLQLFITRVARAAFVHAHASDDKVFNEAIFNRSMKRAMYNSQRNERKRVKFSPKRVPKEPSNDSLVVNIPNESLENATKQTVKKEEDTESEASTTIPPANEMLKRKADGSPAATPRIKRTKAIVKKPTLFQELVALGELGAPVQEAIDTLKHVATKSSQRRSSRANDKITELVVVLNNLPEGEPWKDILSDYEGLLNNY